MSEQPTRILIVDDSALYRQTLQHTLREIDNVAVVGIAKNGNDALEKIEQLDPDLLTLDVQMPDMNGIELLREIKRRRYRPKAIMVSSFTSEGAESTTDALLEGAFDFILKPSGGDLANNRRRLCAELTEKIDAFRHTARTRRKPNGVSGTQRVRPTSRTDTEILLASPFDCRAILIGTSTGGPAALRTVLPKLPVELSVPVLVVQHLAAQFTASLANRLDSLCEFRVVEACDGMDLDPQTVFLAPGGHHMRLARQNGRIGIQITDDPPEHNCRPAVDYLFRSAAPLFRGHALGLIMTGMGRDGVEGCRVLKAQGGTVFAQDEEGCIVYGMPKAVVEEGLTDRVLRLGKIAPALARHVKRSRRISE